MRSVNLFVERDSNIPSLPALATTKPNSTRFPFAGLSSVIRGFLRAATAWWRSLPRESSSPTPRTAARRRPSPASCCGTEKAFDALRYWAIGADRSIPARAGESERRRSRRVGCPFALVSGVAFALLSSLPESGKPVTGLTRRRPLGKILVP